MTDLRARAEAHLRALVGREDAALRDDQWSAIAALVEDRRRTLVVQKTGWGKSAVYFVATLLLRSQGAGPTVIVSPLLALMRNQIAAAERAGIRAATINSTNLEDWSSIEAAIHAGELDVLLVSPERLNNPGFRDAVLPRLAAECGLLVVDEAHCISDWGHDFRPDYRRIRTLLGDLPAGVPVLATTATANARVTADVAEQLGTDVLVLRGSLDRESLQLGVVRLKTAEMRLAWLAGHVAAQEGSGIVYCLTVATTEEVADYLRSRGIDAAAYSGRTEPAERSALEESLAAGRIKVLVATSALGMGYDAPLGFVVNLGAPSSPVSYYQQVGRAGRGIVGTAPVVLLPSIEDRDIWAYFASLAFPREEQVRQTLSVLSGSERPLSTQALEPYVDLSRTRLDTMLKVLDVDGAVQRVQGGWRSTGEPWSYDAERYARVQEARRREEEAMLGYLSTTQCRMRYLREQLDDPSPGAALDCGRCDNCGGLELSTEVSADAVAEADERLHRPGVPIEPKKLWPSGLSATGLGLKGRIAEGAEEGRVIARLTDLGHGGALRALLRPNRPSPEPNSPFPDAESPVVSGMETVASAPTSVPAPLARAMVEVVNAWLPAAGGNVDGIVVVESLTRNALVQDLAAGLSRYLHRPVLGSWAIADPSVPPGAGATNSAHRVAAVTRRFTLRGDIPPGARVLLVDDLVATGWTLTCAAVALREAGADAVLPLALASES